MAMVLSLEIHHLIYMSKSWHCQAGFAYDCCTEMFNVQGQWKFKSITNRPTNQPTNQRTDIAGCRVV